MVKEIKVLRGQSNLNKGNLYKSKKVSLSNSVITDYSSDALHV